MAQPALSLCMIVKNEEEMLPGLLESVDGLWDELVVADTGSTDNTVALLTDAGARIVQHTWQDDFAAARNASLAEATGDWILFLDADERLTPTLTWQIRELLADPDAGAATVVMRNDLPGGLHREASLLRIFRNEPGIAFEHRIHEDVSATVRASLAKSGRRMVALSGVVLHLGYVKEVAASKDKKARDLALLEKSVQNNPRDFYCWFKILEQARFWDDQPLLKQTASRAVEQWQHAEPDLQAFPWSGELVAILAQGLFDEPVNSLEWLDLQGPRVQQNGPFIFRRGMLLESLGRLDEAENAFTSCLNLSGADGALLDQVRPLLGLCRLAAAGGDTAIAAKYARQAASVAPRDPEALVALTMFVGLSEGREQLESIASDHVRDFQDSAIVMAQALLTCGQMALAQKILTRTLTGNEEAALGLLTIALIEGLDWNMEINITQEAADMAFQSWVTTLMRSRQRELIDGFLNHCGGVVDAFPWLPEWLKKTPHQ